ncbi:MAG: NAD(P)/FAD-dependent oxidoreductase [Bdellovibrionales bacterium]|nr:NAD(P)/FAD-dependent oxidoreductase [Bdellovibrionales bacterium]
MAKKVIIVGGGFGGINAAKILARDEDVDVLVLDRRNHHLFQPLLYQVAMAGLSPAEIAFPIRSIFRRFPRVGVLMADVREVRPQENKLITDQGEFSYDYLVLACGSEHSYFGHNEWEDFAPGLKTLEQATEIRRRVLVAFERAEAERDKSTIAPWLTFVIVGGGPTGVELAGALGEITRFTLAQDFRHIDPSHTRVILIEAGPRILSAFPDELSERAERDLRSLGVETAVNTRVTSVNAEGVRTADRFIPAKTVIWAAGVKPSPLNAQLGSELDKAGRVVVDASLALPHFPNIFVVGDQAHVKDERGQPLPGLAPIAMQEGRFVGRQIRRDIDGREREKFSYWDKGTMATIGRKRAVAMIGRLRVSGFVAWLMWLLIHIYYLIGFRNRALVLWNWTYSYLTYRRGARLITERDWHLHQ